jgi:hypothetical protein
MKKLFRYLILCVTIIAFAVNISYGQVRIAVSKVSGSYEAWLLGADPQAVIVNMYGMKIDSALLILSTCHGLLMTGGEAYPNRWLITFWSR